MTPVTWVYQLGNQFIHDFKNLRNKKIEKSANEGIRQLSESDNPRNLGEHKVGKIDCIYGYNIGRQYRILYEVFDEKGKREIVFYRVGLHNIYKTTINRVKSNTK